MQIPESYIIISALILCLIIILLSGKSGDLKRNRANQAGAATGILLLITGLVIRGSAENSGDETGIIIQIIGLSLLILFIAVTCSLYITRDRKPAIRDDVVRDLKHQLEVKQNELDMTRAVLTNEMEVRSSFETDLLESEEKFRSMAENTPLGMVLIDRAGTIQYMNPQVTRSLGFTFDEFPELQSVLKQFLPDSGRWDLIRARFQDHAEERVISNPESVPVECILTAKDGSERIVELYFAPYGNIMLLLLNDITRRKEAEDALHESDRRYREMMEQIPLIAIILDKTGSLSFANNYLLEHTGWRSEEILNTGWFERFTPPEENAYKRYMTAISENKTPHNSEGIILTRTGESRSVLWTNLALLDAHGRETGVVSLGTDITEMKAREQAIQLANKKLNILSSITRHDIANMLSAVYLNLELILDTANDPQVRTMIAQCLEASKVIQDHIEFTRFYQDIGVHTPEWYSLQVIIEIAIQNRSLGPITVTSQVDQISIYADPLILTVFSNLIDNAIRHGERITHIGFTVSPEGQDLIIRYTDDGVGVPPDDKEKIFERGFGKHTGMGLFLIREILAITGIQIHETGTYGKGAVFVLSVPAGSWRREHDEQSS